MHSITLHKLDDLLVERIKEKAGKEGKSLNSTIKGLLSEALGLVPDGPINDVERIRGYRRFLSRWSEDEARDFESSVKDFEVIDPDEWR